jgi:preprotein translocase subunit SecF
MRLLKLIPEDTNIGFVRLRYWAFGITGLLTVLAVAAVAMLHLNLGVDFVGGLMIEAHFPTAPQQDALRTNIDRVGVGQAQLQPYGDPRAVAIRLPPPAGGPGMASRVVDRVNQTLRADYPGVTIARYDTVSGKVSDELVRSGILAVFLAIFGIAVFSWFRYEWQFGVSTFIAIMHDVLMTLGFFAITRFEFDLSTVAAVLTIIGYSINDKIVVDDRIRENMRKYRKMDMGALIDLSVNEVLPRTVMTSITVLLALGALLIFGGHVLRGFTAAMMLGIVIGTYSSIYVSASMLITLGLNASPPGTKLGPPARGERKEGRNEGYDGAQV